MTDVLLAAGGVAWVLFWLAMILSWTSRAGALENVTVIVERRR